MEESNDTVMNEEEIDELLRSRNRKKMTQSGKIDLMRN